VEVLERTGGIEPGALVTLQMRLGPLRQQWLAEHCAYEPEWQFRDVQVRGPFAYWEHTHRMEPDGEAACYLEDAIRYALPGGLIGRCLAGRLVRRKLERLFTYRHAVTMHDLAAHAAYGEEKRPMQVLVSGSTGLVGSALVPFLTAGGHQVRRLVRTAPQSGSGDVSWDPARHSIAVPALEGVEAVVNLAGENIATDRWTAEKKRKIYHSRIDGTRVLCEALAQLASPPQVLVNASAIGYYGSRGAQVMREESTPGADFLAQVCRDWEAATAPAEAAGIRVVQVRIGVVMSPKGGALHKMLTPFKMGLGGVLGSGEQYVSWIAIDDVVESIHHVLMTEAITGPVNVVAPHPVTNREFTKILGRVLKRPTLLPMPTPAARLAFGEMGEALLLSSTRVEPARLTASGYTFRYPDLEGALRHLLGR
jgi:uncharacterized protein (TIGR01777 family)